MGSEFKNPFDVHGIAYTMAALDACEPRDSGSTSLKQSPLEVMTNRYKHLLERLYPSALESFCTEECPCHADMLPLNYHKSDSGVKALQACETSMKTIYDEVNGETIFRKGSHTIMYTETQKV